MITPSFECEQTDDFVIVKIRVPHVKISAIEYTITDKVFHFYVKPYFLRLTFDNELAENGTDTCKYDIESGIMIVNLPKKNHGEHFADLNMMTKLLSGSNKQKEPKPKSLIEVIGDEPNTENEEFEYDWEQTVPKPMKTDSSLLELEEEQIQVQVNNHPTYGFDNSHQQFFTSLGSDYVAEVISLRDPDTTPNDQRTAIRTEKEDEDFDPDHYVADVIMNQDIQKVIEFKARYQKEFKKKQKSVDYCIKWMDIEKQALTNLPKKEYLIQNEKSVFLGLVDILCSYCYNHRTTTGENTVESGWTICKLSTTLSYLEEFQSLSACLQAFIRRALTYPLYRHYDLAIACIRDVCTILKTGKDSVLRCLLETKFVLEHSQDRYLLCKLFIDDYAVWIQRENDLRLTKLAQEILECTEKLNKDTIQIGEYSIMWLENYAKECEQRGEFAQSEQDMERPQMIE